MLSACFLFFLSSCSPSLSPFTKRLYDDQQWQESELKQIQYYLSEDIVLRRQLSSGASKIVSGEIKIVNGREVEEVILRKGTPGVLLFTPDQKKFAVSFESENDEAYLMFGPNPKRGGRYVLLGKDWNKRKGEVTYNGEKYNTTSTSAMATLLIDLEKINQVKVKSREARGRVID